LRRPPKGNERDVLQRSQIAGSIINIFCLIMQPDLMVLITAGPSLAFRCGTSLVSEGDMRAEVARKCGEPDYIDSWEEERILRDFRTDRYDDPRTGSRRFYREPFLVKEKVKIDVWTWTYNLGSTQFTRYLTFENGVLVEITTGDKGY